MKKGVTWAKWNVVDFLDGTVGLEPALGWPYTVVLMLIYRDGGATANDAGTIGRRCGMRPTSVAKSIAKLVEMRKLILLNDGRLTNNRASDEIAKVVEKSIKSQNSANRRWGNGGAKGQQYQRMANANAMPALSEGNANGMPRKELRVNNTTTSESVAAREESVTDRASSSGLEGPTPPSESSEQVSSQGGEASWLVHLPAKRREAVKAAFERSGRDPSTGERITG